ncbi:alpha/beta fold hydrolase [Taklimakanibacter deserti]|uniref:alpha/beta fold hydrolase n=1 Tax=Taklimakanibacter deserti TaxID=2267839 RepID=UPI0034D3A78C
MNKVTDFAEVGSVRLRYSVSGAGPDLLLIHGVGSEHEDWDGVVAALKSSYRTIAFDLRGHGESSKPAGPYALDDFVMDARGLLDKLGVERCHLAGFSLGGLVAQGFALSYPERLHSVILLSTVAGRTEDEKRRVRERLAIVADGIPGQHFENSVARWFTDEFRARNPRLIAELNERSKQNDPKAYAAAYRVLAESDLADRLPDIRLPTLVATGEDDIGSNTRMARLMAERIPAARLHIFPRMRHSILTECPEDVACVMSGFLEGVEGRQMTHGQ